MKQSAISAAFTVTFPMLDVEGDLSILHGPCMLEVKAGHAHRITALTDLTWLCIHAESVADPETLMKG
ncbi:hypothetical protein [Burkholderia latens]|uniref:AraC family transcriptional regulator n=1 Tax=Burkholderia latens TaxID=488446 RepID=A0A6H9THQ7_9BURK|nr:hypothetical protein [Burkholderia latens]KAB0643357.1 hypothetical protein F7R21_07535 [Burkholderia latens]VWB65007.1 hypothetical protein BLA24064_03019 [Burkholderia latens]